MKQPKNVRLAIGVLLLIAGVLTLAVGGCVALVTLFLTPTFTSTAIVAPPEIKSDVGLEAQKIRSHEILLPVVTNLNLQQKYSAEFHAQGEVSAEVAYTVLLNRTTIRPHREQNLVEIVHKANDPSVAATNANAIARSYIDSTSGRGEGIDSPLQRLVEPAKPPYKSDQARWLLPIFMTLIAGGLFAIGGFYALFTWKQSLTTQQSIRPSQ